MLAYTRRFSFSPSLLTVSKICINFALHIIEKIIQFDHKFKALLDFKKM